MGYVVRSRYQPGTTGFTLIELSVVLTIIGLIVGGIVGGQALVRNAELKGVVNDYGRYLRAVKQFRDQYKFLPGDFPDATEMWGVQAGTGSDSTCAQSASSSQATCNGNGDSQLWGDGAGGPHENLRFWQHLANAGYIKGSYSGSAGAGNPWSTTITNSPSGPPSGALWGLWDWTNQAIGDPYFTLEYGRYFWVGGYTAGTLPTTPLFTPKEVYGIDQKIDDGRPGTGTVIAYNRSTCSNASSNTDYNASYSIGSKSVSCSLFFRDLFKD